MDNGAVVGRRYFCCLCAAVFAKKSGIPREKLEQDILDRVPQLDAISTSEDNRFTADDALKALTAYDDSKYIFLRRATLERLSGIPIPANKRNGRKQKEHLIIVNSSNAAKRLLGENIGSPSKQKLVEEYLKNHPEAAVREVAKAIGCSTSTAYKWMRK